jgi:hypothetical protein
MKLSLKTITSIPTALSEPLELEYSGLLDAFAASNWEQVGLKAGKICEITICILENSVSGVHASGPTKPANFLDACRSLEKVASTSASRSVRIQVPRVLSAVYELRNNRSIGHVGGDVDPNEMDAEFFLRSCQWILAEIIRVFHKVSVSRAHETVNGITAPIMKLVWNTGSTKKVLNSKIPTTDKIVLLLQSSGGSAKVTDLAKWTSYQNLSRFRSSIIKELDNDALISYSADKDEAQLSPTGVLRAKELAALLKTSPIS